MRGDPVETQGQVLGRYRTIRNGRSRRVTESSMGDTERFRKGIGRFRGARSRVGTWKSRGRIERSKETERGFGRCDQLFTKFSQGADRNENSLFGKEIFISFKDKRK
jgi:hypothetical protein